MLHRALSSLKVDIEEADVKSLFNAFARPLDKKGNDVEVVDGNNLIDAILEIGFSKKDKEREDKGKNIQVCVLELSRALHNCKASTYSSATEWPLKICLALDRMHRKTSPRHLLMRLEK